MELQTSMIPRDGTLNKHGTQGWNFKHTWYPGMEPLNKHGTVDGTFKQAWYPGKEL
jgi:hypothetical protein